MKIIAGELTLNNKKIALVASRFNSFIVENLISGAKDTLIRHGLKDDEIDLIYAPGAFEIPLVTKKALDANKYDGIVALGCVIRGGTPHFEYVAGECVKGLANLINKYDTPVAFGILTVDTIEQAIERAGTKHGNKGVEAAMSVIEMINLLKKI